MDSMRREVEKHLNFYQDYCRSLRASLKTKRSINKIKNYATKLRRELEALTADPVFLSAGNATWFTVGPKQHSYLAASKTR
jgi:hypothetical protein